MITESKKVGHVAPCTVHLSVFGLTTACGARSGKRDADLSKVTCEDCASRVVVAAEERSEGVS